MQETPVSFAYTVRELSPGRFPFQRWRWELWQGELLVAAGWVMRSTQVERALRRAASRRMHQIAGVTPLRPERSNLIDALAADRPARLDTGAGTCLLVPVGAFGTDAAVA